MIIVTTSSGRHWQSNTNSISPRSPLAAGRYPGLCRWHRLLAQGRRGHSLGPLPGWVLGFGQRQGLLQGAGLCGAPLACQVRVPWDQAAWALGAVAVLGCGAQLRGSTRKLWLYLYFFRFFFLLFWQQTYPSRCPGESKTVHRGLLPCQPLRTGVRAEVLLRGRDHGKELDLCPPTQPNPLAGAGNLGYQTLRCPPAPSHPMGHRCRGLDIAAENGHSSMPL